MGLLTKERPLHAAIETAEAEAEAVSQEFEQARATSAALRAKAADIEAKVKEARIAEAMGEAPSRADLKAVLGDLSEEIESADARVIGLQRRLTAASARLTSAKDALRREKLALINKLGVEAAATMHNRCLALHQDQQELLALAQTAREQGFNGADFAEAIPVYLLHVQLVSTYGGGDKLLPKMGDRYNPSSLFAPRVAEILEQFEAL